jgi:hypothetical protein
LAIFCKLLSSFIVTLSIFLSFCIVMVRDISDGKMKIHYLIIFSKMPDINLEIWIAHIDWAQGSLFYSHFRNFHLVKTFFFIHLHLIYQELFSLITLLSLTRKKQLWTRWKIIWEYPASQPLKIMWIPRW